MCHFAYFEFSIVIFKLARKIRNITYNISLTFWLKIGFQNYDLDIEPNLNLTLLSLLKPYLKQTLYAYNARLNSKIPAFVDCL